VNKAQERKRNGLSGDSKGGVKLREEKASKKKGRGEKRAEKKRCQPVPPKSNRGKERDCRSDEGGKPGYEKGVVAQYQNVKRKIREKNSPNQKVKEAVLPASPYLVKGFKKRLKRVKKNLVRGNSGAPTKAGKIFQLTTREKKTGGACTLNARYPPEEVPTGSIS